MIKIIVLTALSLLILISVGYFFIAKNISKVNSNVTVKDIENNKTINTFGGGYKAIVYKEPNCGCCTAYSDILKEKGFDVEVVITENITSIKNQYKIPGDKQSCHTVVMGDYVIEGHVPMEAIEKLLKEKPSIDGIGLAQMPAGTPGMPGVKKAPYNVYQIQDGVFSNFMTI